MYFAGEETKGDEEKKEKFHDKNYKWLKLQRVNDINNSCYNSIHCYKGLKYHWKIFHAWHNNVSRH